MRGSDTPTNGTDASRYAYTIAGAAQLLSLSNSKVEKLVASGELASFKIGKSRRISDAALREFISAQQAA